MEDGVPLFRAASTSPGDAHDQYFGFDPAVIRSRSLLVRVLKALVTHKESLTVIGAHAVFEQTRGLTKELQMD
jgi:hypothetical protein